MRWRRYAHRVATWDDIRRLAMAMPETTEPTPGQWRVKNKLYAWERPLRKAWLAQAPKRLAAAYLAEDGEQPVSG